MDIKSQFTISVKSKDLEQNILSLLDQYGVLILTDFLSQEELSPLIKEYESILKMDDEAISPINYPQGIAKRIEFSKLNKDKFPNTCKTFNQDFMRKVSNSYLGSKNHFNHEIYVAKDEHEEHNALNEMHYDKLSTLKFFLYLNDIDKSNGAFEAVPSSHKISQEIMEFYRKRGKRIKNLPNRSLPKELSEGVAMEAKAGSLIIFTTDTYHRAGRVEKGKHRMIMRGHCRKNPMPKYAPDILSPQWFNESLLNPAKYYYGISDLITGAKI